jgi:pimeloyl-ACP methyl ester carboxylesterase
MKKEIDAAKSNAKKKKAPREPRKLPSLPPVLKNMLGPKPIIRYSHQAALKVFESLGIRFEVRHLGESRLGLLRWPLRKLAPGTTARRLVMVPGFGDTPLSWWSVLAGLKPILKREIDEVVLIDYPGFSGFLHDELAIDSMDELIRVFDEVIGSLKPEIVMGHSLGAWLAAGYASSAPSSLKKLILVDAGGLVITEEDRVNYRAQFSNAMDNGTKDLIPHLFAKAPFLLPLFQGEFFSFLRSIEVRDFIASFDDRHLLNEKISGIRAETILLWGERDTLTPTAWLGEWLERLPKDISKKGIIISGSGHSPQVEKPGVLIALLTMIFLGRDPKSLSIFPLWKVVGA